MLQILSPSLCPNRSSNVAYNVCKRTCNKILILFLTVDFTRITYFINRPQNKYLRYILNLGANLCIFIDFKERQNYTKASAIKKVSETNVNIAQICSAAQTFPVFPYHTKDLPTMPKYSIKLKLSTLSNHFQNLLGQDCKATLWEGSMAKKRNK